MPVAYLVHEYSAKFSLLPPFVCEMGGGGEGGRGRGRGRVGGVGDDSVLS